MQLIDRKRLARLMAVSDTSIRELALAAGWKSHSYMARLLRGEVDTLNNEPARRIAIYLGVKLEDLFVPRVSTDASRSDKRYAA